MNNFYKILTGFMLVSAMHNTAIAKNDVTNLAEDLVSAASSNNDADKNFQEALNYAQDIQKPLVTNPVHNTLTNSSNSPVPYVEMVVQEAVLSNQDFSDYLEALLSSPDADAQKVAKYAIVRDQFKKAFNDDPAIFRKLSKNAAEHNDCNKVAILNRLDELFTNHQKLTNKQQQFVNVCHALGLGLISTTAIAAVGILSYAVPVENGTDALISAGTKRAIEVGLAFSFTAGLGLIAAVPKIF